MKSVTDPCHTDPHQSTRQFVRGAIANWLRTTGKQGVSLLEDDKPLYQLAIDSLGIIEIATSLERGSGKRLNPELIYELETISEIAEYLDSLPVTNAVTAPPPPSSTQLEPPVSSEITTPSSSLAGSSLLTRYQLLNRRVDSLEENGRYFFEPVISQHDGAWVIADGQRMLMLAPYEYLGLLSHQRLKDSAVETVNEFGTGLHGTRLLAGTTSIHRQLEAKLSSFMGTDDAIVFNSGYITNLAVISALVGPGDRIIGDQWNHASIVDGCRLSGADLIRFDHNNVGALEESLRLSPEIPTLVVVDAVYSMDGDIAPIRDIVQLCREYNALLMVDEAHSVGVLGRKGRGIQEHFDLDHQDIDIKMGTLSKALACSGGFVAACA